MKKSYNLNYIWSKFVVDQFVSLGLKNVVISPGSRNTPLTTAFAECKKIRKHVIVDERSNAFFALGIAKATMKPVAIITTSGTATANLYPAIIEACQQRVPLIICTADRPEAMRNSGANQTINQKNIFGNHIRYSIDFSLPQKTLSGFESLQKIISKAYHTCMFDDIGPVHLNFQFDKPLEKSICDVELSDEFIRWIENLYLITHEKTSSRNKTDLPKSLIKKLNQSKSGLIVVGWDNYNQKFVKELIKLSEITKFPILADGASGIYFGKTHKNILVNHQAFLRSDIFSTKHQPEIIIQFGNPPTSNAMLNYLKNSSAFIIAVNKFGDRKDSGQPFDKTIKFDPLEFCRQISTLERKEKSFLEAFQNIDERVEKLKEKYIERVSIKNEISIIHRVASALPTGANLFVSNSTPIRDLDFFKSKTSNKIKIFVNRGASGIDGINSTAAGIASASNKPTLLITGDLSFFHDSNGLQTIMKYKIPLQIILINNGGGAIFGMLPVAKEENIYRDYFFTPIKLQFRQLIKTYKGNYYPIRSFEKLSIKLNESISKKQFSLFEIKTDHNRAIELRKKYFKRVLTEIEADL